MDNRADLIEALKLLGELLASRGLAFDIVVIGGGALLLNELIRRPTMDLDAMARIENGRWVSAKPLPQLLVAAIRDVADTLGLAREPRDEKDWLNGGPSFLRNIGLPDGFDGRATKLHFGPLTVRVASRQDLIFLKLWAATDAHRQYRRPVDIADLQEMKASAQELREAVRWCAQKDGRADFAVADALSVFEKLGIDPREMLDA